MSSARCTLLARVQGAHDSAVNLERALLNLFVWPAHRVALRLTGGRARVREPTADGMGTLVLVTTGRRSGERRERPLYYMRDGDRFVVVASNAGDERDPAWWLNLQADPEADVRTSSGTVPVRAREVTDEERARLWPELVRRFAGFARYVERTARRVPVIILEP